MVVTIVVYQCCVSKSPHLKKFFIKLGECCIVTTIVVKWHCLKGQVIYRCVGIIHAQCIVRCMLEFINCVTRGSHFSENF